jgi:hypothetical protein
VRGDTHIVPNGDLVRHLEHRACWCGPRVEALACGRVVIVVHQAADGREQAEQTEVDLTAEAVSLQRRFLSRPA